MNTSIEKQFKKAKQSPGIYIFKSKSGEVLYIGKAGNLRNRIRQYLKPDAQRPYLKHLLDEAEKLEFKTTDSEIEALILESKLIKEKQPKYNIMLRDGKQYFYVVLTKEEFPKIFLTHQPSAVPSEALAKEGPFTDGAALKTTLRLLRKIFPYCTCKQKHNNFCLNYHIGKCPGYCCLKKPATDNSQTYRKNIKAIEEILAGKKNSVIRNLKKELGRLAEKQNFEKAIELRNKIEKLERVFENARIISRETDIRNSDESILIEMKNLFKLPKIPNRIEGYDISNIQGQNAAGAMIVFTHGQPDKNDYRKFKIYFRKTPDDTAMLKEVLIRRFNHPEWPYPDLIFIDGGRAQINAARKAVMKDAVIISLAKGKQEVFSTTLRLRSGQAKPIAMKKLPPKIRNLIFHIDSEAHRFAIGYYRKLHRKKSLE